MAALRILHLEDDELDADLVRRAVTRLQVDSQWHTVSTSADFLAALGTQRYDAILSDQSIGGYDGLQALRVAKLKLPGVPFIFVSGRADEQRASQCLDAGADDFVPKDQLWRLRPLIQHLKDARELDRQSRLARGRALLVEIVKHLSLARSMADIQAIVRRGARQLNEADGATFVLRDGDRCYYADEDAIGPLWKGRRFPMSSCISGWAMAHRQPAVVPDIYADPRIPVDAYRPTFVKSLVMVPIRADAPIGAIGNYWASPHEATSDEVSLIQALADTTSVAIENVQLYAELEQRVRERTAALEAANQELEAFAYSVSHDLRAPLRAITGYGDLLTEQVKPRLDEQEQQFLDHIGRSAQRMGRIIDDLLKLSQVTRSEVCRRPVDLGEMARECLAALQAAAAPGRVVSIEMAPNLHAHGDPGLLRLALENLLSNAWKYTGKQVDARITFGVDRSADGPPVFCVGDNGAGFDMAHAQQLFEPFRRLHAESEFPGTGVGLAIVQRVIRKHGGRIWAEAAPGQGARFHFTLPAPSSGA